MAVACASHVFFLFALVSVLLSHTHADPAFLTPSSNIYSTHYTYLIAVDYGILDPMPQVPVSLGYLRSTAAPDGSAQPRPAAGMQRNVTVIGNMTLVPDIGSATRLGANFTPENYIGKSNVTHKLDLQSDFYFAVFGGTWNDVQGWNYWLRQNRTFHVTDKDVPDNHGPTVGPGPSTHHMDGGASLSPSLGLAVLTLALGLCLSSMV